LFNASPPEFNASVALYGVAVESVRVPEPVLFKTLLEVEFVKFDSVIFPGLQFITFSYPLEIIICEVIV
jgi:hypothetical protein